MKALVIEQREEHWMVTDPTTGFLAYGDTREEALNTLKAMFAAWVDTYVRHLDGRQ